MSLLAAQSLTVTARIGAETVPVIRNLDFTLARGKILGLVGESGAGKSMVGRAIAQLLPPGFAVTGGRLEFAATTSPAAPGSIPCLIIQDITGAHRRPAAPHRAPGTRRVQLAHTPVLFARSVADTRTPYRRHSRPAADGTPAAVRIPGLSARSLADTRTPYRPHSRPAADGTRSAARSPGLSARSLADRRTPYRRHSESSADGTRAAARIPGPSAQSLAGRRRSLRRRPGS